MNILWFSWKDEKHPEAGGAEVVSSEIRKRLAENGHSVRLITSRPKNHSPNENISGVDVYRVGSRLSVYLKARRLFKKSMSDWPDVVIDEMNTIPFFCAYYTKKPSVLLAYQLARSVWFYQLAFPFSLIGYLIEPIYLRLLSVKYKLALTESMSSKKDLEKHGFRESSVKVFRIGMELEPINALGKKPNSSSIIYLGAVRPMKRTLDVVKAFERAKKVMPELTLTIAGNAENPYGQKVKTYIQKSAYRDAMDVKGRVSSSEKNVLLRNSSLIVVTSIKEGWGLIVTEANSQGTPALAYDVDGVRDSVRSGRTGVLVPSGDIKSLADGMVDLLQHNKTYDSYRKEGWGWSKEFTFDNSYEDFRKLLSDYLKKPV